MITATQQEVVRKLTSILEAAPELRVGQLMAQLGVIAEDMLERNLWDLEDEELLRVIDRHLAELQQRQAQVA